MAETRRYRGTVAPPAVVVVATHVVLLCCVHDAGLRAPGDSFYVSLSPSIPVVGHGDEVDLEGNNARVGAPAIQLYAERYL